MCDNMLCFFIGVSRDDLARKLTRERRLVFGGFAAKANVRTHPSIRAKRTGRGRDVERMHGGDDGGHGGGWCFFKGKDL